MALGNWRSYFATAVHEVDELRSLEVRAITCEIAREDCRGSGRILCRVACIIDDPRVWERGR